MRGGRKRYRKRVERKENRETAMSGLLLRKGVKDQSLTTHQIHELGQICTHRALLCNGLVDKGLRASKGHSQKGQHSHGEDRGHLVQGCNEDANLTDTGRQQQGPRRLSIGFAMAKDLGIKTPSWGWRP